jgi:hypothetical protein
MFNTPSNRRLSVFGFITILLSLMVLVNNLITVDFENWITVISLGLAFLLFAWAYFVDREGYSAIGAYVTLAVIILIAMTTWFAIEGVLVPTYVLSAVALPFILTWVFNSRNWAMLIPAYVLLAIIPILYMGDNVIPELVPAYVLAVIGIPFLVAFLFTHKWALLIPSGVLFVIATSFLGLAFGLPANFLSIGLPVIALAAGLILLWRAMLQRPEHQDDI